MNVKTEKSQPTHPAPPPVGNNVLHLCKSVIFWLYPSFEKKKKDQRDTNELLRSAFDGFLCFFFFSYVALMI